MSKKMIGIYDLLFIRNLSRDREKSIWFFERLNWFSRNRINFWQIEYVFEKYSTTDLLFLWTVYTTLFLSRQLQLISRDGKYICLHYYIFVNSLTLTITLPPTLTLDIPPLAPRDFISTIDLKRLLVWTSPDLIRSIDGFPVGGWRLYAYKASEKDSV